LRILAFLLLLAPVVLQGRAFAQGAPARISAIAASGRLDDLHWPGFASERLQVTNFYRPFAYQPAWIRDGQPTAQALALMQILEDADQEGLSAEDYDASRWPGRIAALKGPHGDADDARFDATLTICIMRYLSDLHVGRINPQHLGFDFDVSQKKLNLAQFIRQQLVSGFVVRGSVVKGSDLRTEVAGVAPPFAGYQRLRDALQHYMELTKQGDGEKVPDPSYVAPGGQYAGIPQLTARLRLLGDLPESAVVPADTKIYTGALVDAVKHFQDRHGLRSTGELDTDTVAEINVPLSERVEQMRLSLERLRWLPYEFKQPPVVVNIPEWLQWPRSNRHHDERECRGSVRLPNSYL
jgi:murein L,D-transpeptidase YcbB/YkuD